jgi:hypothetical protein
MTPGILVVEEAEAVVDTVADSEARAVMAVIVPPRVRRKRLRWR